MTHSMPPARERRLALFAWMAVCLIWGTTYLGIRISLETMPPMLMAGCAGRSPAGCSPAIMVARGERLPRAVRLAATRVVLGFLMLVLGNGGVVLGRAHVPSGLAAVVVASSPFWMAGVEAFRADGERMTGRTALGFVLGFLGIVVLIWPELWTRRGAGQRARIRPRRDRSLQIACLRMVDRLVVLEAPRTQRERVQRARPRRCSPAA